MNALEVKNVYKKLGKKEILKNISFDIKEGEIVGFVGPNGAGKTTTLKTITNLIYQDSGDIYINGFDVKKHREKVLQSIGAIVENPGLYKSLTGRQNLKFISNIRKISNEKLEAMIKFIGLEDRIDDKVFKYSLGMKQRLALGMSLIGDPKLLILDEPTNGLDPTGTMELREMLKKLSRDRKIAIFISSHILSEIEKVCDRIIFIRDGEIVSIKENIKDDSLKAYKINILTSHGNIEDFLKNYEYVLSYKHVKNDEFQISIKDNNLGKLLKEFTLNDIDFSQVEMIKDNLEDDYDYIFKGDGK